LLAPVNADISPPEQAPTGTLRIGFQNIGGFSVLSNSSKDDILRYGVNLWEFDIFGMVELNVDWRLVPEHDRLYFHTKSWWETVHISASHNITSPPGLRKQFGGTALFSLGDLAHRVIGKGSNPALLGRWSWTLYRGKSQCLLKIYTAYRPNPPLGPFSVYAQHRLHFNSMGIDKCPRAAFLDDLANDIKKSLEEGAHIMVMLDGNEDM
jgi:hypothetical protein